MRAAWGRARVWTPPRAARTVVTGPQKAGSDIERVVTLIDARAARYDRTPHRITTGQTHDNFGAESKRHPRISVDSTLPSGVEMVEVVNLLSDSDEDEEDVRPAESPLVVRDDPPGVTGRPSAARSCQIGQQQRIGLGHQRRRVRPGPAQTPAGRRRPVRGGEDLTRRRREAPDAPAAVVEARVGRGRRGLLGRLTHHDVDEPERSRPARQGAGTRAHAPA